MFRFPNAQVYCRCTIQSLFVQAQVYCRYTRNYVHIHRLLLVYNTVFVCIGMHRHRCTAEIQDSMLCTGLLQVYKTVFCVQVYCRCTKQYFVYRCTAGVQNSIFCTVVLQVYKTVSSPCSATTAFVEGNGNNQQQVIKGYA